jgi:hypothetical protein
MRAYALSLISPRASSFARQCQVPGSKEASNSADNGLLGRGRVSAESTSNRSLHRPNEHQS